MAFRTLLLDPPWSESGGGKSKRGADKHYALVKTRDMPELIRGSGLWTPEEDAHCYLWVTNNYVEDGLWLMDQLGFRYVTNVVWIKVCKRFERDALLGCIEALLSGQLAAALSAALRFGLGQYFRGGHELLLFGVRGTGQSDAVYQDRRDIGSVIVAPIGEHSAKPVEAYERIEARSKGPYIEFFARSKRPGWTAFGNEITTANDASSSRD